jgi:hypothetical protein
MMAAPKRVLAHPAVICAVALAGLLLGFFLGPPSAPHPVRALESLPRPLAVMNAGEVSVVINAILYDVVSYVVDLPVIMNDAP